MFGKVRAAWKAWRGSSHIRKEIERMEGKPWWKSTQIWGAIIKTGCGILTALNVVEITQEQTEQIVGSVSVAVGSIGTVLGAVLEIWGKRKHAERVVSGGK